MADVNNSGVKCANCGDNIKWSTKRKKFLPCKCKETIQDATFNAVKEETTKHLYTTM